MNRALPLAAAGLATLWIAAALSGSRGLLAGVALAGLVVPGFLAVRRRRGPRRRRLAAGLLTLGALPGALLGLLLAGIVTGGAALGAMAAFLAVAGAAAPLLYAGTFPGREDP